METKLRFLGAEVSASELATIQQVVELYGGLSRTELAATVCELLGWHRASGRVKTRECREWLENLEAEGRLVLPAKRKGRPPGSKTSVPRTALGEPGKEITGSVRDLAPVVVEPVVDTAGHRRFRELVGRYHYLGHAVPYGAHLRYLVFGSGPASEVLGCVQFSSAATAPAGGMRHGCGHRAPILVLSVDGKAHLAADLVKLGDAHLADAVRPWRSARRSTGR